MSYGKVFMVFCANLPPSFPVQFLVSNNSLTDDLEGVCLNETVPLQFSADCGGPSPEVNCPCCSECCSDDTGECSLNLLPGCESARDTVEEDSNFSCDCSPDGIQLSCVDNVCQLCHMNVDDDGCFVYGQTLFRLTAGDAIDEIAHRFEYRTGTEAGTTVTVLETANYDCRGVSIDNQECNSCSNLACLNGVSKFVIDCSNVRDGLKYDGCRSDGTNTPVVFLPVDLLFRDIEVNPVCT